MGCSNDKYEPPKENKINKYLKTKQKIINNHLTNATQPTSDEIQSISKMDLDIFEFLTRNISELENKIERTFKRNPLKRLKTKLEYYTKKKEEFEKLNWQWEELLGFHEEIKKMEKEKEEVIKEKIQNNKLRKDIFAESKESEEEEEEEEEEIESKDYYYNTPFYEENPKKVGEKKDKFDSLIQSEKNEEDIMKERYPFDFI